MELTKVIFFFIFGRFILGFVHDLVKAFSAIAKGDGKIISMRPMLNFDIVERGSSSAFSSDRVADTFKLCFELLAVFTAGEVNEASARFSVVHLSAPIKSLFNKVLRLPGLKRKSFRHVKIKA